MIYSESVTMFSELSFEDQIRHLMTVADKAKLQWGYPADAEIKLLNFTENATFLISSPGFPNIIMRVQRLDYTSYNSIQTELAWINHLSEHTPLSLDKPIKSANGNYIVKIETPEINEQRFVVCFEYMNGKSPIDSSDANDDVGTVITKVSRIPNSITCRTFKIAAFLQLNFSRLQSSKLTNNDRHLYRSLGKICATMHIESEHWHRPAYFERMEWNLSGTLGPHNNFYGESYRNHHWLSNKDIATIDECTTLISDHLALYGKTSNRYGMIHSDLRVANLLQDDDKLSILDFDDCGNGWYMYDIASVVAFTEHRGDLNEVVKEIVDGYEQIRPLTDEDKTEIWTCIMLRRIGMLQSLLCRIGAVVPGSGESQELTPEILAFYAKGTSLLAKRYLKNFKLNPSTDRIGHLNLQ